METNYRHQWINALPSQDLPPLQLRLPFQNCSEELYYQKDFEVGVATSWNDNKL